MDTRRIRNLLDWAISGIGDSVGYFVHAASRTHCQFLKPIRFPETISVVDACLRNQCITDRVYDAGLSEVERMPNFASSLGQLQRAIC